MKGPTSAKQVYNTVQIRTRTNGTFRDILFLGHTYQLKSLNFRVDTNEYYIKSFDTYQGNSFEGMSLASMPKTASSPRHSRISFIHAHW